MAAVYYNNDDMRCAVCDQGIFNPICVYCIFREIRVWLEKENRQDLIPKLEDRVISLLKSIEGKYNGMKCTVCGKSSEYSCCPQCFTQDILFWLSKQDQKLSENFLDFFNFRFYEGRDEIYA